MSILLNSSKQHQAPDWAKPEKNRPIILKSNPSEQLNTTHCLASALAKSYTRQKQVFSVNTMSVTLMSRKLFMNKHHEVSFSYFFIFDRIMRVLVTF